MKASNVSATSFAESRTFRAFIGMYLLMTFLILALIGAIYYEFRRDSMLSDHRLAMRLESETYIPRVKLWLQEGGVKTLFPKDLAYDTAIYNADKKPMVSWLLNKDVDITKTILLREGYIHYVIDLASYEMGDKHLVFETQDDELWWYDTIEKMAFFGLLLFGLLFSLGIYLSSFILRPMREALGLLDDFIQDTTHELNTPVSAILTNIEALDKTLLDTKNAKKVKRISIAARTISTIYDDLTYLILNHDVMREDREFSISVLVHERLEYFKQRYEQKSIEVNVNNTNSFLIKMDHTKASRIIDNLLSNAIKYNKNGGRIEIQYEANTLEVSNTSKGIPKDKIETIFKRYQRADKSVGGFGLGLNIVAMIAKEYGISVEVTSELDAMTTLRLSWPENL